jgi:hypothetical protein
LPKKTVDIILSPESDAIVQIKGNQGWLSERVKKMTTFQLEPISTFSMQEAKKRNRKEYRETSVFEAPPLSLSEWESLFKSICVFC